MSAKRRWAPVLLICGKSAGEAGDLKGNYWHMLFVFCVCVCVCVQAVGGRRDHGAPAGHVHRSGLHRDLQHWASSSAAVPVRSLQKIQQHPLPQLQALLLCYTDGECVCVCVCVCICIIERLFIRANHSELNCVCNHEIVQLRHQLRANWWRTSSLQGQEVTVVIYPRHPWRRTLTLSYPLHIFFWRLIFLFDQCYLFCK